MPNMDPNMIRTDAVVRSHNYGNSWLNRGHDRVMTKFLPGFIMVHPSLLAFQASPSAMLSLLPLWTLKDPTSADLEVDEVPIQQFPNHLFRSYPDQSMMFPIVG